MSFEFHMQEDVLRYPPAAPRQTVCRPSPEALKRNTCRGNTRFLLVLPSPREITGHNDIESILQLHSKTFQQVLISSCN